MLRSIDNSDSDEKTLMSNDNGTFEYLRRDIRSVILLGLTLIFSECGPSNFPKDMEDIPAEEEEGVTFLNQQDIRSATLELKEILPPDELAAFERYRKAVSIKEKIDSGFYFIATYPRSIAVPKVRAEIAWYEIDLQSTINKLFSEAKENPSAFLASRVVGAGRDEFLTSAFTFATRFPHNSNRESVIQLVERYVEIMGYAYVKIDPSDGRMANQNAVGANEPALVKFYDKQEFLQNYNVGNIWTPATQTTIYKFAVVSVDGERVGISEVQRTQQTSNIWVDAFTGVAQTYVAVQTAIGSTLQFAVDRGLLSSDALDEYHRLGTSPTVVDDRSGTSDGISKEQSIHEDLAVRSKRKDECDLSCKRNWVDSCGTGLHTLLPGENYTKAECDTRFYKCLDLCDRKYPSKTNP